MRIIRASEGETRERSTEPIFEGGQVTARGLAAGDDVNVTLVNFGPGARTRWHRHTSEQVLYVVHGIGKVADRDGEHVIANGDCAVIPPDTDHWHGAHDTGSPMSHLSILAAGSETTVLER